ncbi:helix-turn-helix domain-containing protein [Pararhodonellum marinum]|uniref:helix-turn-helix domain-containing protein n=1 Tax=Pararhodonellum marinum TaxID=2755358 RepID=UPI0018901B1C|nr:helix-turn-helix domain-containing protein [Pararhodonellum marinum]
MLYKKFQPVSDLDPYVECLFVWEGETDEKLVVQSPPSGFNAMVFNYKNPYWAYIQEELKEQVPLAFASGQFTGNYHLELQGSIGMIGIVLKANALHNFFGLHMAEMVNKRLAIGDFLGQSGNNLHHEINHTISTEARTKILEDFLVSYVDRARKNLTIIDETIDFIDQKNGMLTIDEVLSRFKISRRYLEKKFQEKVGITPKLYARIKRFGYLSNKIVHNQKVDWQDIVFENGFHDQSHLAKDFKAFNQMNPSEYYQNHRELIRFVEK